MEDKVVMLPDLRVVMLPVLRVVMLPVLRVVMLPPRLVLRVVMLPAKAVDEIVAVSMDAQTKHCMRFIVVSPGEQNVYWVGRAFGSVASQALIPGCPTKFLNSSTMAITTNVPQRKITRDSL